MCVKGAACACAGAWREAQLLAASSVVIFNLLRIPRQGHRPPLPRWSSYHYSPSPPSPGHPFRTQTRVQRPAGNAGQLLCQGESTRLS